MSINPSVTEALDSLLAGLDSLRAERDDLAASQSSRAVTMVGRAEPMVRPARQSRSAEALDAARLLALLASSASENGVSADLAQSAGALLRRLLKQRSVLVPKIHDAAPGIRISPRVAVLLSRLPPATSAPSSRIRPDSSTSRRATPPWRQAASSSLRLFGRRPPWARPPCQGRPQQR